jgi:hypothetical protein
MDVVDWAARERHLVALAPFETFEATVRAGDRPVRVAAASVRATMADVLAIPAEHGRLFTDADYAAGTRVVVLSNEFWRTAFGADPALVGRPILLNEEPFEVIGVLPPLGLRFPQPGTDLWLPLAPPAATFQNRGGVWQRVVARLNPGVTLAAAQADMDRIARELAELYPTTNKTRHIALVPLREGLVGTARSVLSLVAGAVVLVLLVAWPMSATCCWSVRRRASVSSPCARRSAHARRGWRACCSSRARGSRSSAARSASRSAPRSSGCSSPCTQKIFPRWEPSRLAPGRWSWL